MVDVCRKGGAFLHQSCCSGDTCHSQELIFKVLQNLQLAFEPSGRDQVPAYMGCSWPKLESKARTGVFVQGPDPASIARILLLALLQPHRFHATNQKPLMPVLQNFEMSR